MEKPESSNLIFKVPMSLLQLWHRKIQGQHVSCKSNHCRSYLDSGSAIHRPLDRMRMRMLHTRNLLAWINSILIKSKPNLPKIEATHSMTPWDPHQPALWQIGKQRIESTQWRKEGGYEKQFCRCGSAAGWELGWIQ
jgi:hypothetical protein